MDYRAGVACQDVLKLKICGVVDVNLLVAGAGEYGCRVGCE